MKKYFLSLAIILIILMAACATSEPTPLPTNTPTEIPPTAAPSPSPEPAEAVSERDAAITAVSNQTQARATIDDEFVDAQEGMIILVGGSVQTFEDSRASLNLSPEGTIIRVGPSSIFTMQTLTEEDEPVTSIKLDIGQIWIMLNGGTMEVETPSGVASVRGSLLGVSYDPENMRMEASCLEGTCRLKNDLGEIELTDGQESHIEGHIRPSDFKPMDESKLQNWVNENPDAWKFFHREDIPEWLPEPNLDLIYTEDGYFGWFFEDQENPFIKDFLNEDGIYEPPLDGSLEGDIPLPDGPLDGNLPLLDGPLDRPLDDPSDGPLDGPRDGPLDGGGLVPDGGGGGDGPLGGGGLLP